LKDGLAIHALYQAQDWFANTPGNFTFNGAFTGYDYADFLVGYAQQYTENAVKSARNWDNTSYSAYIQDHWRAYGATNLPLVLH
jgi:hypothetical protein